MTPDLINGLFEFGGAAFNFLNIQAIWRDKKVRGVSVVPSTFFTAWGFWNLYYYPSLDQWWSFTGGLAIVTMNTVWVVLALYYGRKDRLASFR